MNLIKSLGFSLSSIVLLFLLPGCTCIPSDLVIPTPIDNIDTSGDIWSDEQVEKYFQSTWDWRVDHPRNFQNFWGQLLVSPWKTDNIVGINCTGTNKPDPKEGWRLYEKHLNCLDYGLESLEDCEKELYDEYTVIFPHFSLYNIYMGVLRTFIWIREGQQNDIRLLINSTVADANDPSLTSAYGLSLNQEQPATPITAKRTDLNTGTSTVITAFYGRWAIIERELSYDPGSIPDNLAFHYSIYGLRENELRLTGELIEDKEEQINEESPIGKKELFSYLGFTMNSIGAMNKRLSKAKMGEEFSEKATILEDKGHSLAADGLRLASKALGFSSSPLGFLAASAEVLFSFRNTFSGDQSVQYTPQSFKVELDGGLRGRRSIESFSIPVHGSSQINNDNETLLNLDGALGLYSLSRPPAVEVGYDYFRIVDDLKSLVIVNPTSNMKLVDVKVQPIVKLPPTFQSNRMQASGTEAYKHSQEMPGIGTEEEPFFALISKEVLPQDEASFYWDPRDGHYTFDSKIRRYVENSFPEKVFLKIFMRFEHTDPDRKAIFVEHTNTYESHIHYQQCLTSPPNINDEKYKEVPWWQAEIGDSKISQYTYIPCNIESGNAILFGHSHHRGMHLKDGLVKPDTRVQRLHLFQDVSDLEETPIGNDQLSSLIVPPFTKVTLFEDVEFKGRSLTLTESVADLKSFEMGDESWDNKVSSVKVELDFSSIVPIF